MAKIRTFMAVDVSSKIRHNASRLIDSMVNTRADYKWVNENNLHVTLNFVGDVPEDEVTDLCLDVKTRLKGFGEFLMAIGGVGGFPTVLEPRTIWLGVTEGADELRVIHNTIGDLLAQWRFPKERQEYHPHVTLGRIRRGGRWNQALTDLMAKHEHHDAGMCQVGEVIVYSSFLEKSGPTHTAMTRAKLK